MSRSPACSSPVPTNSMIDSNRPRVQRTVNNTQDWVVNISNVQPAPLSIYKRRENEAIVPTARINRTCGRGDGFRVEHFL